MFGPWRLARSCLSFWLFVTVASSGAGFAQTSKSAPLAQELAKLLDAGKLEAIATRHGNEPDRFMAALYFPGQLLIVSAKYAVPPLLVDQLQKKNYRDIYVDLSGASFPDSRVFIEDVGADGLTVEKEIGPDSFERGPKTRWIFNGQWRRQQMASEDEYRKNHAVADAEYAEILTALILHVKKSP